MSMIKRKEATQTDSPQGGSMHHIPAQHSVSFSVPTYRLVSLRRTWLLVMFLLGVVSQFLLAIYTPAVWNFLYGVIRNFAPTF